MQTDVNSAVLPSIPSPSISTNVHDLCKNVAPYTNQ